MHEITCIDLESGDELWRSQTVVTVSHERVLINFVDQFKNNIGRPVRLIVSNVAGEVLIKRDIK